MTHQLTSYTTRARQTKMPQNFRQAWHGKRDRYITCVTTMSRSYITVREINIAIVTAYKQVF